MGRRVMEGQIPRSETELLQFQWSNPMIYCSYREYLVEVARNWMIQG